jgi:hypothetical protein
MAANRYLVLAGLLVGSSALAAPGHRKPAVDAKAAHADADAGADAKGDARRRTAGADAKTDARRRPAEADARADTPRRLADAEAEADVDAEADDYTEADARMLAEADAKAKARRRLADAKNEEAAAEDVADARQRTAPSGWTFAIGPYVWASSVHADVSFGPLTTGVDLGFISIASHTRYGAEVVLEARRGRFGISGDIMYGAAAFESSTEIASVMTNISGNVASLMLDSALSYEVIGGDGALFSLEARPGVRYQRTTIQGEVGVAGFTVQTPEIVDSATDLLLGARAGVRPTDWLLLAGAFDIGVAGDSDSTWSTTLDASLRVASWFSVTAGWRSLTMRRSSVNTQLSGPRVALQLLF